MIWLILGIICFILIIITIIISIHDSLDYYSIFILLILGIAFMLLFKNNLKDNQEVLPAYEQPIKHTMNIAGTEEYIYVVNVPYVFTQEESADNFIKELNR